MAAIKQKQAVLFSKCYARIDRAALHAKRISEIWNEIPVEDLSRFVVDVDDDGKGSLSLDPIPTAIPDEIQFELGYFLYQLRAALDGAIYASAIEDTGLNPPPKPSSTEFPVCEERKEWKNQLRKIASLNDGRTRFIALMQPFEEPELEPKYRIANFNRCLRLLNEWARLDRHRFPHTFTTFATKVAPQFRCPDGVSLLSLEVSKPAEIGMGPIARFSLTGWKAGMNLEANPRADLDLSIKGMEPPCHPNDSFPNRLRSMLTAVRMIIQPIENNAWKAV